MNLVHGLRDCNAVQSTSHEHTHQTSHEVGGKSKGRRRADERGREDDR
jgi:hypothetical protein